MTDFPARPLTQQDKKDILADSMASCREKDCVDLFLEIEEHLKERDIRPTYDLIQEILNI